MASLCKSHRVPPAARLSTLPKILPRTMSLLTDFSYKRIKGREKANTLALFTAQNWKKLHISAFRVGLFFFFFFSAPSCFCHGFPIRRTQSLAKRRHLRLARLASPASPRVCEPAHCSRTSAGNKETAGAEPERAARLASCS